MDEETRPTPEELLEAIKREESQKGKGNFKIFLGMAAGVGKTFAMLEAAQQIAKSGTDVVIGIVNTHGRKETAELTQGLEVIPEKTITYRENIFKELDLDAILERKPQVVLLDELAHTNIVGSRHAKRWQDVLEILDNGIDVYSTLNVQHIESLNDVVKGITGIAVRETVPDSIVERANSIQLVDLTPEELLVRLKDGKVYLGDQSKLAIQNFFKKDRLTALREIVLRYTAEKVDRDLRDMAPMSASITEWKPRDRILVAVSHSPAAQKLIRITRRLASNLNAPWIALHVNKGRNLSERDHNQLAKNLQLARDLGAEVVTINDPDIVNAIKRFSHQRGVTQIVLGRPPKLPLFGFFKRFALLDKLARECEDIDIHVFRQERYPTLYQNRLASFFSGKQLLSYLLVAVCVVIMTLFSWWALPLIGYKLVGFIFLLGILNLSLVIKKGPILFAAILYALIWVYFFIPPAGTFKINIDEDLALIFLYALTAIIVGHLLDRAREDKEMLIKNEKSTQILYEIVRNIASAASTKDMIANVKEHLEETMNGKFEVLIKKGDSHLDLIKPYSIIVDDKEINAAIWSFENGKDAGWSTDTLPSVQNLYIPLKGYQEVVGLLVYKPRVNRLLTIEELNFLHTVAQQMANYIERTLVSERLRYKEQVKQIEKTHKSILERLSKEFEKPLSKIESSLKVLKKREDIAEFKEIGDIERTFEGFSKILNNISAMAQLSDGLVPLNKTPHSIQDVIEDCCDNLKKSLETHRLKVTIEENLPLVSIDFYLIEILLFNLLRNATEYSPPDSAIEIEAKRSDGYLVVSIADEGKGIAEDQMEAIFEKFYRHPDATSPGIGLGLAIAKTIAENHQGFLTAENLPVKGAKFSLYLPIGVE